MSPQDLANELFILSDKFDELQSFSDCQALKEFIDFLYDETHKQKCENIALLLLEIWGDYLYHLMENFAAAEL